VILEEEVCRRRKTREVEVCALEIVLLRCTVEVAASRSRLGILSKMFITIFVFLIAKGMNKNK